MNKEKLEKELIDQCKETAKLNLEICDEFKYVDGENIDSNKTKKYTQEEYSSIKENVKRYQREI